MVKMGPRFEIQAQMKMVQLKPKQITAALTASFISSPPEADNLNLFIKIVHS